MAVTYKQLKYIKFLRSERDISPAEGERLDARIMATEAMAADAFSFDEASKTIQWLLTQPKTVEAKAVETSPPPSVPEGRYALVEEGTVKFFKVDRPTEGRWSGYVFVKTFASDTTYPVKNPARRAAILNAIAADIEGALKLYGRQMGVCGHCGRKLTSDWRNVGIGPICAENLGYSISPTAMTEEVPADAPSLSSEPVVSIRTETQIRKNGAQARDRLAQVGQVKPPKQTLDSYDALLALRKK